VLRRDDNEWNEGCARGGRGKWKRLRLSAGSRSSGFVHKISMATRIVTNPKTLNVKFIVHLEVLVCSLLLSMFIFFF
jgi:hypothetical protein